MNKNWFNFQEEIKVHFNNIGCTAETNIQIQGVRTNHDIDILVQTKFLGHNLMWLVEAKCWNKRVSKLHVLALRQIVDDVGADKGFIISNKGFQKGAIEAIKNTNIHLLTFDKLKELTNFTIQNVILNNYLSRVNLIVCRYFSHSKDIRKKYELKTNIEDLGNFNVYILLLRVAEAIKAGKKNEYPIDGSSLMNEQFGEKLIDDFNQLVNWLNLNLLVIDERIFKAEIQMQLNNEFTPDLYFESIDENLHMLFFKSM